MKKAIDYYNNERYQFPIGLKTFIRLKIIFQTH
jgi:hypothetical protein